MTFSITESSTINNALLNCSKATKVTRNDNPSKREAFKMMSSTATSHYSKKLKSVVLQELNFELPRYLTQPAY